MCGFIPLLQSVIEGILLNPAVNAVSLSPPSHLPVDLVLFFLASPPLPHGLMLSRILLEINPREKRCRPFALFAPGPLRRAALNHVLGPGLEDLGQERGYLTARSIK